MIGGLLLVAGGAAGAAWALRAATSRRRPIDLAGALLAPVFVAAILVGGVMCFVPRFLR
ncbi:MAG TPA: hypothetical protein VGL86_01040 [Polyangia bacterium]